MPIPSGSLPHRLTAHLRAVSGTDAYGNELREDVTDVELRGRVDLASTGEDLTDRNEQRERYTVILRPDVAGIDGWDGLTWDDAGYDLELEGPATAIWDAVGVHHLELSAYRTRG